MHFIVNLINNLITQSIKNPKAQIGKFTTFLKSGAAITAASAMLITPAVLGIVDQVTAKSNLPISNVTIVLLLAAVVLFVVAGFFGGIIQNILLGGVIGLVVNALLTVPAIGGAVSRVSRTRSG